MNDCQFSYQLGCIYFLLRRLSFPTQNAYMWFMIETLGNGLKMRCNLQWCLWSPKPVCRRYM